MKSGFKKIGFYFSELIITTLAYSGLIWYFATHEYVFSAYNREISWIILSLFTIGLVMILYHLSRLYREDSQIAEVSRRMEAVTPELRQLQQTRSTLNPEALTDAVRRIIDTHIGPLPTSLIKTRLYSFVHLKGSAHVPMQEAISHLLQQKQAIKGNRVRYIAGILVMIGLLGTFLGLVQAIKYLQHFFTATESVDFTTLFSDMKQTLGGLDKAFGTSIGGITAYLVLGYLNTVLRIKQTYIVNQIEEFTLDTLLPAFQGIQAEERKDVASRAVDILRTIPDTVSQQLRIALEDLMQQTIGGSAEHLRATSTNLQHAAEGIQTGQALFTKTLQNFGDFLTLFQEGKDRMMQSQETLSSGVQEFSQAMAALENNQQMLASSLELTQRYVQDSEERLHSMDQGIRQIQQVWQDNQQGFAELTQTIHSERELLAQTVQRLDEVLNTTKKEALSYFQSARKGVSAIADDNTEVSRALLESHTMLTTLLHEMKTFILDEQNGLQLLSSGMRETFGEARFQYMQLTEHLEELYKRLQEGQEHTVQLQETTSAIHQHLQTRR